MLKDELQDFKLLDTLREYALQSRLASEHSPDFHSLYQKYKRRQRIASWTIFSSVAASVAAFLFFVINNYNANKNGRELQYFLHHSEWIAISDEAILTSEYIRLYNQHHQTLENDLIWPISEY